MLRDILPSPVRLLPAALSLCALALVGCDDGSTSSSKDDPGKKDKVAFSSISEIYGSLDSAETVVFLIRAWVMTPDYWPAWFDLNERIYTELPLAGFHFPFPQLDVHLHGNQQ